MTLNAIHNNKILANISGFTVVCLLIFSMAAILSYVPLELRQGMAHVSTKQYKSMVRQFPSFPSLFYYLTSLFLAEQVLVLMRVL